MAKKYIFIGSIVLVVALISIIVLFANNKPAYETYDTNTPARVGEVHLIVSNLERSVDFYQQLIGFDILTLEPNKATLTADGHTPLIVLEEVNDSIEKPFGTTGLYHLAILLPDRTSFANTLIHLADNDYPMQGAANHQYSDALYLADPDDNGIEIYVDLPPEKWERDQNGGYVGGSYPIDLEGLLQNATSPWTGLPKNTRIGHMHLQVAELEMIEEFYVNGLGFDIMTKVDGSLFISKDHYHHTIALNIWSGANLPAPPENSQGLKKFTLIFTQEEIEEAKLQLQRLNFPFEESNGTLSVADPSGNKIEIIKR